MHHRAMNQLPADYPEQTCTKCLEAWPADSEFFYADRRKPLGLSLYCKACYEEMPSVVAKRAKAEKRIAVQSGWERLFQHDTCQRA